MQNSKLLENKINIKFKNKKLLLLSLTHKSYNTLVNNEKLEFLGDRVLGLVLSKKLFNLYPNVSEGKLDNKFASLVNRKTCLKISKILELEKFLILGRTYKSNMKVEDKILSDASEALIGAIYLDSGYKVAETFIIKYWEKEIEKTINTTVDSKTKLQEYSLRYYKKLPIYKTISFKGPAHIPSYKVSVKIVNSNYFYGVGSSKKIAELVAAEKLIKHLKIE